MKQFWTCRIWWDEGPETARPDEPTLGTHTTPAVSAEQAAKSCAEAAVFSAIRRGHPMPDRGHFRVAVDVDDGRRRTAHLLISGSITVTTYVTCAACKKGTGGKRGVQHAADCADAQ